MTMLRSSLQSGFWLCWADGRYQREIREREKKVFGVLAPLSLPAEGLAVDRAL